MRAYTLQESFSPRLFLSLREYPGKRTEREREGPLLSLSLSLFLMCFVSEAAFSSLLLRRRAIPSSYSKKGFPSVGGAWWKVSRISGSKRTRRDAAPSYARNEWF